MSVVKFRVGNIRQGVDEFQLAKFLGLEVDDNDDDDVTSVQIGSGPSSGMAMVTVPGTMAHRLSALNGTEMLGKPLLVNRCHVRKPPGEPTCTATCTGRQFLGTGTATGEAMVIHSRDRGQKRPVEEDMEMVMATGPVQMLGQPNLWQPPLPDPVAPPPLPDSAAPPPLPPSDPVCLPPLPPGGASSVIVAKWPLSAGTRLTSHNTALVGSHDNVAAVNRIPSLIMQDLPGNSGLAPSNGLQGYHGNPVMAGGPHHAHRPCLLGEPHPPGLSINVPMPYCYDMVDIGAHLTHFKFSADTASVIRRAQQTGIQSIIVTSLSLKSSQDALMLVRRYPDVLFFMAGVHPHEAKSWKDDSIHCLEGLVRQPECVAIGECGLDFYRNFSEPDVQIEVFERQVELACRLQKPLFLHERDAHEAFVEVLSRYHSHLPPVVVHCFTGTREQALKYLAMGFYLGVTGFVCSPSLSQGLRDLMYEQVLPVDRIMLETNAPFVYVSLERSRLPAHVTQTISFQSKMAHHKSSPERTEPCSLPVLLEVVARCMGLNPTDVAQVLSVTSRSFFALPQ